MTAGMNPHGIALVVSDVDGTLVTSDKRLAPATVAAVARLREAGIGFTIASARPAPIRAAAAPPAATAAAPPAVDAPALEDAVVEEAADRVDRRPVGRGHRRRHAVERAEPHRRPVEQHQHAAHPAALLE